MLTEPSIGSTLIEENHCSLPFPDASLLIRCGAPHVAPPSREASKNTSGSPLRLSHQFTKIVPESPLSVISTPIDGSPDARPNPLIGKSQPTQSLITEFLPKLTPASVDLAKNRLFGPAQTTYTSPFGPVAG